MASKIKVAGNHITCVYDDRFRPLLEALGTMRVERASDVEYNPSTKEWEARTNRVLPEESLIAHGPNRNDVITEEVKWLEEHL